MSEFKNEIRKALLVQRPNLTPSSLKTYSTLLNALARKMNAEEDIAFFTTDPTEIIKFIDHTYVSENSKKTILSALFVLTNIQDYRVKMYVSLEAVTAHYKTQNLSERQAKNRISYQEVLFKVAEAKQQLRLHPTLNNYQNYLIGALMCGLYTPPKRNEFGSVKLRDYDPEKDNFYRKGAICFNSYKTVKSYGPQCLVIPKQLQSTFENYVAKIGDQEYLFQNLTTGKPFSISSNGFTNKLHEIFGVGIGCSALRSIFLSEKYKDHKDQNDIRKTAMQMGHSVKVAMEVYVKK